MSTSEHGQDSASSNATITSEQFNQMMNMMKMQLDTINALTTQNAALQQNNNERGCAVKRPDRPVIDQNSSDNDWELFLDSWSRYKRMTNLTGGEATVMELRACCSTDVNKLLFQYVGAAPLNRSTEEELIKHIRSVAVKGVHPEVHRLRFTNLRQEDTEQITQYIARLKAQTALCDFFVTCPTAGCEKVSYAEDMISHQLIAGLRNQEFQSRVLSEAGTLTTLEKKIDRLQSLESTEECAQIMHPTTDPARAAAGKKSSYKEYKKPVRNSNQDQDRQEWERHTGKDRYERERYSGKRCNGCGRQSHPTGKSMSRKDCPAIDQLCNACGIKGHYRAVCRQRTKANRASGDTNTESDIEEDEALASALTFF